MSFSTLLDKTGTVERQAFTLDSTGTKVAGTWSTVVASVPVAVQPASARIRNEYAQRQQDVTHKVFTTTNPGNLQLGDRWTIGGLYYVVQDFIPITNAVIGSEGMYTSICKLIRA